MLHFGALPPETNSGRLYSGPGSAPMLAAAAAWDAVSNELFSTATGFGLTISELIGSGWSGPASAAMANAAAPYVAWLYDTAAQAEHTAAQAKAAAAAYELAFAMTVPPPVIAANRSLLAALVATNFFGQNTAAIAATEAHYAEMWVQDATAMYGYAGSSAAASPVDPFTGPPATTNPAGVAAQSGALAHPAADAGAAQAASLPALLSMLSTTLQQLVTSATSGVPMLLASVALHVPNAVNTAVSASSTVASGRGIYAQNERLAAQAEKDAEKNTGKAAESGGRLVSTTPAGTVTPSVQLGRASLIKSLSVPPNWATTATGSQPVEFTLANANIGTATADVEPGTQIPGSSFSQSVLGTLSRQEPENNHAKSKPIITRTPAAG